MARVNVTLTESPGANSGVSTNVGTLFAAGVMDQGVTTPVGCQSMTDYTNQYGPRSTVSAAMYDTANYFFANGGTQAYFIRVSDDTATTASLTLEDATPAGTVIVSALTPGVAGNDIYVTVTDDAVVIEDSSGDVLESWPFSGTNAALLDVASAYVTFTQVGAVTLPPAEKAPTALSGGADSTDITDADAVAALAGFPPELGPGPVALPGRTSATAVVGLFEHGLANNRFAIGEQADAGTSASAIAALNALDIPAEAQKAGIVVQGRPVIYGTGGVATTIPASGAVAAAIAQAAATGENPVPAFSAYPLAGLVGFTTGQNISQIYPQGVNWVQGDVDAMTAAGLCAFGYKLSGALCLNEFVTPNTEDDIFWEGTAWIGCMMLVSQCQAVAEKYEGAKIDGQSLATTALHGDISTIVTNLWTDNVLYGDSADDAASINTGSPVNTAATAQAGQLNVQIAAKIAPYADAVDIGISILSLTQTVGASS